METNRKTSAHLGLSKENVLADIKKIVAEQMDILPEAVGADDHLINDVGCDSLDIMEISMCIEEHFDIMIPDEFSQDVTTTNQMADGVMDLLADGQSI